jgi:hypothetical protein
MVSHRCLFVTSSRFNHRGGSESHWMCVCFTALVRFFQVLPLQNVTRIHERLRFPNEIVYRFVPGCPGFKRSTRDKCYFDVHHPPHYRHGFPRASLGLQPTVDEFFEANPWNTSFGGHFGYLVSFSVVRMHPFHFIFHKAVFSLREFPFRNVHTLVEQARP